MKNTKKSEFLIYEELYKIISITPKPELIIYLDPKNIEIAKERYKKRTGKNMDPIHLEFWSKRKKWIKWSKEKYKVELIDVSGKKEKIKKEVDKIVENYVNRF